MTLEKTRTACTYFSLGSDKEMQIELARRRLAAKRERMAADRNTPEPVKSMDCKYY